MARGAFETSVGRNPFAMSTGRAKREPTSENADGRIPKKKTRLSSSTIPNACPSMASKTNKTIEIRPSIVSSGSDVVIQCEDRKLPRPSMMRAGDNPDDIVVVVGTREFPEKRQNFASLSKVLKDPTTNRFEFPNRDPKEWGLVRLVMDPFSDKRISPDNLTTVLPWFELLGVHRGISQCDDVMAKVSIPIALPLARSHFTGDLTMTRTDLDLVLEALPLAFRYNLATSKHKCLNIVRLVFQEGPHWLEAEQISRVVWFVLQYSECDRDIWPVLQLYVPSATKLDKTKQELLSNDLFPMVVLAGIEGKDKQRRTKLEAERLIQAIGKVPGQTQVRSMKKELKKDKVLKKMLPKTNW